MSEVKLLPLPANPFGGGVSADELREWCRANMEPLIEQLSDTANALAAQTEVANHCKAESEWLRAENERLAEALRRAEGLLRSAGIIAESDLERPHSIATEIKNALRDHDQEGPMTDDLPLRLRKAAHIEPEEVAELMEEAAAALEAAREDAERLDWLDTQRSDDVQGSYPDEPQLVWHYWDIDSPDCTDVRDAIDQARGKGGAGK